MGWRFPCAADTRLPSEGHHLTAPSYHGAARAGMPFLLHELVANLLEEQQVAERRSGHADAAEPEVIDEVNQLPQWTGRHARVRLGELAGPAVRERQAVAPEFGGEPAQIGFARDQLAA